MYAACVAAVAVMTEGEGVASHAQRVFYANSIISGNASLLSIARMVLTNATIAAEATVANGSPSYGITDGDIQFTINSVFNALAGVAN